MDQTSVLRENVTRLENELREAKAALKDALIRQSPFQVGDVIKAYRRGKGYARAQVRAVEPSSWGGTCWYRVSFEKKDGSWSERQERVYDDVRALDEVPAA